MNNITNPILPGFHPDPCICRKGDDYYIATSTFEWFPGIRLFHSKDLINWTCVGHAATKVSQLDLTAIPNSGGIWAPGLSYSDGKFWLIYSNVIAVHSPWKVCDTFLMTAENIEGPWSEPVELPLGGFDPDIYHAEDGKKYVIYRIWGPKNHSNPHNTIALQEYFPETQTLDEKRVSIFKGTEFKLTEGPHIYKRNGYFYLVTAEGGTSFEHAVTIARSKSITGPYELHPDKYILTTWDSPLNSLQKAGHGSFVQTENDEWYMAFLTSRPLRMPDAPIITTSNRGYCPLGRETGIVKLVWINDWPYVDGGKAPLINVTAPQKLDIKQVLQGDNFDCFYDDFDSNTLSYNYQTLRIPFSDYIGSLTARSSCLRLYGRDPLVSQHKQSLVAHRWQHHSFDSVVKVDFRPRNFQQTAGITCYYNTENFSYFFVSYDKTHGRVLRLVQLDHNIGIYHKWDDGIPVPDSCDFIYLKVSVRELTYQYSYSFDGENWISTDISLESWKLSDDYIAGKGFFTGAFVGMHCGDSSRIGCHADFDSFSYQSIN